MHWTFQNAAWIAAPSLELTTAIAMFWRGVWRQYAVFWSYLIAEVLRAALLFSIGNNSAHYFIYFYFYWVTEALICLLGFFVVAEIFRRAFSKQLGLQRWGRALFRVSLLCLIVLAVLTAAAAQGNEPSKLVTGILVLKRVESLVRLGLVVALLLFVTVLGVPWSSYTSGIAMGFVVYGILEFCAMTARFHYGRSMNRALTSFNMGAAFVQNVIWFVYFGMVRKKSNVDLALTRIEGSAAVAELAAARQALDAALER